jgi:hypothetical protein
MLAVERDREATAWLFAWVLEFCRRTATIAPGQGANDVSNFRSRRMLLSAICIKNICDSRDKVNYGADAVI